MKKVLNYLVLGFIVMFLFTYIGGLFDDAFRKTGIWYKDVIESFKYYVLWVLPYWWFIILIGTFAFALFFYGIRLIINKIT